MDKLIVSFRDKKTSDLYHGSVENRGRSFPPEIIAPALRKLDMLHAATTLYDLRSPPGNCLESLRGRLRGFYSIRVNNQWRIIFRWDSNNAYDVQLTDYH